MAHTGKPARTSRRGALRTAKGVAVLAAAEVFLLGYLEEPFSRLGRLLDGIHDGWWKGHGEHLARLDLHSLPDVLGHTFASAFLSRALPLLAALAVVSLPLGALTRMVARARIRAGQADFLAPLRAFATRHARAARALAWSAGAAVAAVSTYDPWSFWSGMFEGLGVPGLSQVVDASFGIVAVLTTAFVAWTLRAGARAFLAPTLDAREPTRVEVSSDEITFDAVAVTRETIAAVAAMAILPLWPLLYFLVINRNASDTVAVGGMIAQAVIAFGGAAYFRRASKVAVGVDGVLVSGTTRTRFFAYRDLDGARVEKGGDLVLLRGKRVVLRLQLHGQDASRRDAVMERITESIERVKSGHAAVAAQLVSGASAERLASAALGGADYRGAALTREQLWALVEGPEVEESARRAAAEALARTGDDSERARLRVAAEHCAAPQVRVALLELADSAVEEETAARSLAT